MEVCKLLQVEGWDDRWDGSQTQVLFYGGDFCVVCREVFAVSVHNGRSRSRLGD